MFEWLMRCTSPPLTEHRMWTVPSQHTSARGGGGRGGGGGKFGGMCLSQQHGLKALPPRSIIIIVLFGGEVNHIITMIVSLIETPPQRTQRHLPSATGLYEWEREGGGGRIRRISHPVGAGQVVRGGGGGDRRGIGRPLTRLAVASRPDANCCQPACRPRCSSKSGLFSAVSSSLVPICVMCPVYPARSGLRTLHQAVSQRQHAGCAESLVKR